MRQPSSRPGRVPLGRALSKLGLASRSEGRGLIAEGRVTVNGRVARDGRILVDLDHSRVAVDDAVGSRAPRVVIALHKPRGVITSRRDPQGRPTVYSLLVDVPARVVPAGRLDLATSGLLLLTNDTALADWLTDPASQVEKVYLVTVRGRVSAEDADALAAGMTIAGELLRPASVRLRKASTRESHLVVTLTEGRNREIRRLFEAVGREVTRLRRVRIGGLELGSLAPGRWRLVDEAELGRAFPALTTAGIPIPDSGRPAASSRPRSPARSAPRRSAGRP